MLTNAWLRDRDKIAVGLRRTERGPDTRATRSGLKELAVSKAILRCTAMFSRLFGARNSSVRISSFPVDSRI